MRAGVSLPPSGAPLQRASPRPAPGLTPRGPPRPLAAWSPPPAEPLLPAVGAHSSLRGRPPPRPLALGAPSSTALPPRDAHPGTTTPAHGPARASTPRRSRCARISRATAGSVMNATIRAALPQRGTHLHLHPEHEAQQLRPAPPTRLERRPVPRRLRRRRHDRR